jgi:hypothetical protein
MMLPKLPNQVGPTTSPAMLAPFPVELHGLAPSKP